MYNFAKLQYLKREEKKKQNKKRGGGGGEKTKQVSEAIKKEKRTKKITLHAFQGRGRESDKKQVIIVLFKKIRKYYRTG